MHFQDESPCLRVAQSHSRPAAVGNGRIGDHRLPVAQISVGISPSCVKNDVIRTINEEIGAADPFYVASPVKFRRNEIAAAMMPVMRISSCTIGSKKRIYLFLCFGRLREDRASVDRGWHRVDVRRKVNPCAESAVRRNVPHTVVPPLHRILGEFITQGSHVRIVEHARYLHVVQRDPRTKPGPHRDEVERVEAVWRDTCFRHLRRREPALLVHTRRHAQAFLAEDEPSRLRVGKADARPTLFRPCYRVYEIVVRRSILRIGGSIDDAESQVSRACNAELRAACPLRVRPTVDILC